MPTTIAWIDRLRIERAVWAVDAWAQSMSGRSRRALRRELRTNLRASASEVGAAEAIRRLGDLRLLAEGYLDAEYAGGRRPRLRKAVFWTLAVQVVILWSAFVGHAAFVDGVEMVDPRPDGTFGWDGLKVLGIGTEVGYTDGQVRSFGLSANLWTLLLLLVAFLTGGRYWRALPRRRRRPIPDPTTPAQP
jgi:hypothetical protein